MEENNSMQLVGEDNQNFEVAIISVLGNRDEQQDSFGYSLKETGGIVVVCDGMGGYEGGWAASHIAVESVISDYNNSEITDNVFFLKSATKKANKAILNLRQSSSELFNAGSTLVALLITENKLFWNSVGDSRAYLIRNEQLVQLTLDHNYNAVLNDRFDMGEITLEEFEEENKRGDALISFIGLGEEILVDYNKKPLLLEKYDKIIIMSDGLYKLLEDEEIGRIVNNFSDIGEALLALEMKAQKNAGENKLSRDNMTVALIKIK